MKPMLALDPLCKCECFELLILFQPFFEPWEYRCVATCLAKFSGFEEEAVIIKN